jgi:glutaminyl-tRNA synthetase
MEDPPKKYYRLAPGTEVRLRYGYFIRCVDVKKDAEGNVMEVRCTYDPETRGGNAPDGRKVQGTIHWVSIAHAVKAETRLYDHLFLKEDPDDVAEGEDWKNFMNMESLKTVDCFVEPSLANVASQEKFQFERIGYFCADPDSTPGKPVFNRTVTLKDSWSKMNAK